MGAPCRIGIIFLVCSWLLACQQAAVSLDLQSIGQMDALRKALGVAPNVDPIATCKELGVDMSAQQE